MAAEVAMGSYPTCPKGRLDAHPLSASPTDEDEGKVLFKQVVELNAEMEILHKKIAVLQAASITFNNIDSFFCIFT